MSDVVDAAIESEGDLVLDFFGRIGARPFVRFTPYENNRGVRCHHWTILSIVARAMPERTLLFRPVLIEADDSYPLRHFSTPWIRQMVRRDSCVQLVPAEHSPFAGDAWVYHRGGE